MSETGEYGYLEHKYERSDTGQFEGVIRTESLNYNRDISNSFQLKLDMTKIGDQTGEWSFDIPVKETAEQTILRPDLSKSSHMGSIQLNRVVLSSVSTQVNYHFTLGKIEDRTAIGVDLVDDTGVRYGSEILNFAIGDQVSGSRDFAPVTSGAKALIVRPFYYDNRYDRRLKEDEYFRTPMNQLPTDEAPLVLPLREAGKMYITGIKYLADRTMVYCRTVDSGTGFIIENEHGNWLPLISWGSGGAVEFEPIPQDAKLTFLSRPTTVRTYIPELELRIDLPQ
jgi:hypothetical protein